MQRRIVIVGGGAAGVFTAYRLRQRLGDRYDLVLLEKNDRVGGNAQSTTVRVAGEEIRVECGAQFFHRGAQDNYIRLLEELSLLHRCRMVRCPAGFTIWDRRARRRRLHLPAHPRGFASLRPGDWVRAAKFGLFIAYCWFLERTDDWSLRVDDWLAGMRLLDEDFKQNVIKPFLYQFVSLPGDRIGEASAKYAITYFVRSMFGPRGPAPDVPRIDDRLATFETYQSLVGLDEVHRRVLAAARVTPRLRSAVRSIEARGARVEVVTADDRVIADHVVLATDPHTSARFVADPELARALGGLEYARLPISLHAGTPTHMPPHRADWQPFNTIVDGDDMTFSVWFGPMRPRRADGSPVEVFKSWGSPRLCPQAPPTELVGLEHHVPLPTATFVERRDALLERWQGRDNVWFAGGWTRWFDTQEAALMSADAVARSIACCPAPERAAGSERASVERFLDRCAARAPAPAYDALTRAIERVGTEG